MKKLPQEGNPHTRLWCAQEMERHFLWLSENQGGGVGKSLLAAEGDGTSGLRFGAQSPSRKGFCPSCVRCGGVDAFGRVTIKRPEVGASFLPAPGRARPPTVLTTYPCVQGGL